MQAVIETRQDGTVLVEFDSEAARTMVASIIFASRFHEEIAPLAGIVEIGLQDDASIDARRMPRQ